MRFPGATSLTPEPEKPPSAFDIRMPVLGITIFAPKLADSVTVHETALPSLSTIEKWVVSGDSCGPASGAPPTAEAGVARSGSMAGFRPAIFTPHLQVD